ncbi:ABC transporter permease [Mucilaginibacter myungsuensis]|uniref:ABC transporter permease n=1 Tax=Mucilaginibacter myungsuensis TaxID=649104 RepID=A0A929PXK8_9SPHI|nr:ABC transporter permease [Mucilaginibacter myungsuensis]MBE9662362.1 ABC transporter permease [Mucilaginibacter myungsuensis]MDN3599201.1 ABC transporter permease [Mucilaginibacter myungsuensis]
MKGFLLSLRSEFFKSRKTLGFWAAIIMPFAICVLVCWGMYSESERIIKTPALNGMLMWRMYSGAILNVMGFLLPFFIILVAYSVNGIEHKADTWKTLFSLPISKWSVYAAKYFYTMLMIVMCLALFLILTIVTGNLLGMLKPQMKFTEFHMEGALAMVYLKLFLSSLGILSIQFLLSLVWSDFLKPMGIGFIATIGGMICSAMRLTYAYLIPYSHPMMALESLGLRRKKDVKMQMEFYVDLFTKELYVGLVTAVVVFIAGYYIVQRKSVK